MLGERKSQQGSDVLEGCRDAIHALGKDGRIYRDDEDYVIRDKGGGTQGSGSPA